MQPPRRHRRPFHGLVGGLAISAAALAATAGPAMAAPSAPGNPRTDVVTPYTEATAVTFSWDAATPEPGTTITGYEIDSADSAGAPPNSPVQVNDQTLSASVSTPAVGKYFIRVRAVQSDATVSPFAVTTLLVDRADPTVDGFAFLGTKVNGFYAAPLTIKPTCSDDNPLPGGACADIVFNADGVNISNATGSVTDAAGRVGSAAIPAFSVDASAPTKPKPTTTGELVPDQPTLAWLPSLDSLSGVDHYDLQWQEDDTYTPGGWKALATVPHKPGAGEFSAKPSSWTGGPFPVNTLVRWRVVAVDAVGNRAPSSTLGLPLTVDPTVPAAPEITGGPNAPTRDSSPTFTWSGDGARFQWNITLAGGTSPLRGGAGTETSATVPDLADGSYVLHVTQFTAAQRESAEASRSFTIDTTAPVAPTILTRPTFPAIGAIPTYTWSIEPGAYSRWSVLDAAGNVVLGPVETPVTTAELPTLPEGPYTFQVLQFDAAGNASPVTAEAFTVLAPLVAPTPAQNARTAFLAALPKQNALKLQPKAGTTLPTLRPVLKWKKGPRGTKLYNLQIFQVTPRKGKAKPRISKVLSRFPRGLQFRPSKSNLKPNTCYVWRVWPYTGTAFTARPVGVSNFCVAGSKVLRAKAAKAAATRAAARAR